MNKKPEQPNSKRYLAAVKRLEEARQREAKAREPFVFKEKFNKAAYEEAEENLRKFIDLFKNPPQFPKEPVIPLPLP